MAACNTIWSIAVPGPPQGGLIISGSTRKASTAGRVDEDRLAALSRVRVVMASPTRRAACTSGIVSSTAADVTRI
jgi:hypothetical protein